MNRCYFTGKGITAIESPVILIRNFHTTEFWWTDYTGLQKQIKSCFIRYSIFYQKFLGVDLKNNLC